ncbi:hypothetical protein OIU85_028135 [Salix viminalis]|uniref:Uncharacterized protein n=1 Tax=Salix viminalis TaxID=40686 RepID=A0A9Q0TB98_SALVM|nr:hypothetical protein OIU85_028135 [Salix viminalis]
MPFFSRGDDDQVDDYDEYDPTPYGGGYDITLTYGRPFPSSDETCYPINSASGEIDCDRPHYSSYSEPSAYADEALETEYNSYARPKPPPGSTYGGPQPAYGFQPGMNRPGSEYGSDGYVKPASEEYGRIPESDYGPDGNGKPQGEEYGSGYGRRPESEYESGDHERPSEYGSGYGRRQESEYGSMYETMRGHRVRNMDLAKRSSHGRQEGGGEFGRPSHGSRRSDDDDEDRRSKYRDGGEEGHGRKKYVGFSQNFQLIMLYGFLCNVRSFSVHGNVGFCVAFAFVMF